MLKKNAKLTDEILATVDMILALFTAVFLIYSIDFLACLIKQHVAISLALAFYYPFNCLILSVYSNFYPSDFFYAFSFALEITAS